MRTVSKRTGRNPSTLAIPASALFPPRQNVSISDCCEDVDLACAWLDFWYTKEGSVLTNYGQEGRFLQL